MSNLVSETGNAQFGNVQLGNVQFGNASDSVANNPNTEYSSSNSRDRYKQPNDSQIDDDPIDSSQPANWLNLLPKILRGAGAIAVVISLYTFLAKGWDASGDLTRYLVFLGHTIALAGIGLFNAKVIKETKGARLLLILALFSIPMIFAILGGFIFSGVSGVTSLEYPSYVTWSIGSFENSLWVSLASSLVLAPVVLFGFMVLVRQVSRKASLFFMLSNLLLLVPFRQPELVGLIAMIAAASLMYFYQVTSKQALALKTLEGKVAIGIQFVPVLILLTRSFWLYQFDAILVSTASLIGFFAIRLVTQTLAEKSLVKLIAELVSVLLTFVIGVTLAVTMLDLAIPFEVVVALSTMITSGLLFEMSFRGQRRAASYRVIASVVLVFGLSATYLITESLMSSLLMLLSGLVMLVASFVYQQKGLLVGGLILLSMGLYHQLALLITGFEFNYWIALAGVGISLIVCGSYLEANAGKIKNWLASSKNKIAEWQY